MVALGLGRWEVTDHLLDGRWAHIGEPAWDESAEGVHRNPRTGEVGMAAAVRALSLELREPLLIIVLGGMVGFIVIALFMPLIALIQNLSGGGK